MILIRIKLAQKYWRIVESVEKDVQNMYFENFSNRAESSKLLKMWQKSIKTHVCKNFHIFDG